MKNVLNVIVDILTLMALCVAAVGHILPWFGHHRVAAPVPDMEWLAEFQKWHALRSGIALGVLGLLIGVSLIFNWGPRMRRFLNLGMFGSAFAALLFELMVFSQLENGANQRLHHMMDTGFFMALVPTCFALFFSLVRMLWTMPPTRSPVA